jgi:hypothetical protein
VLHFIKIRITRREQIFTYTLMGRQENQGKSRVMLFVCSHFQLLNSDQIRWSRYSDRLQSGQQRGQSLSPGRVKNFFSTFFRQVLGPTQGPMQWVLGALSPGLKRQGREADNSPPTSAEVKETGIYTRTSPCSSMS